jgi:hypothetical protein
MKMLVAVVLATLVASPVFAQARNHLGTSAARAAAIHQCSVAAYNNTYKEYNTSTYEIDYYRACMAERGQVE